MRSSQNQSSHFPSLMDFLTLWKTHSSSKRITSGLPSPGSNRDHFPYADSLPIACPDLDYFRFADNSVLFVGATNLIPPVSTSSRRRQAQSQKSARPLMHLQQAIKAPQPSTRGRKRQSAKCRQSLAEFSLTVSSNEAQHILI